MGESIPQEFTFIVKVNSDRQFTAEEIKRLIERKIDSSEIQIEIQKSA